MKLPTLLVSIAILLTPLAIWAQSSFNGWQQPLVAAFSEPESAAKCITADTLVLGTAETGYKVIKLSKTSDACGRP